VVDIELQALEGAAQTGKLVDALAAGDAVDVNDNAFGKKFPYVALPNAVAVNTVGGGTRAGAPTDPSGADPTTTPEMSIGGNNSPMSPVAMTVGAATVAAGLGAMFFTLWWRRRRGGKDKHHENPVDLTIPLQQ
jgi:hypothetical protein